MISESEVNEMITDTLLYRELELLSMELDIDIWELDLEQLMKELKRMEQ